MKKGDLKLSFLKDGIFCRSKAPTSGENQKLFLVRKPRWRERNKIFFLDHFSSLIWSSYVSTVQFSRHLLSTECLSPYACLKVVFVWFSLCLLKVCVLEFGESRCPCVCRNICVLLFVEMYVCVLYSLVCLKVFAHMYFWISVSVCLSEYLCPYVWW